MSQETAANDTYDHRLEKTGHPVRSAILKFQIGRLVVGWVTTSESLLLYVFFAVLLQNMIIFVVGSEVAGSVDTVGYRNFPCNVRKSKPPL